MIFSLVAMNTFVAKSGELKMNASLQGLMLLILIGSVSSSNETGKFDVGETFVTNIIYMQHSMTLNRFCLLFRVMTVMAMAMRIRNHWTQKAT